MNIFAISFGYKRQVTNLLYAVIFLLGGILYSDVQKIYKYIWTIFFIFTPLFAGSLLLAYLWMSEKLSWNYILYVVLFTSICVYGLVMVAIFTINSKNLTKIINETDKAFADPSESNFTKMWKRLTLLMVTIHIINVLDLLFRFIFIHSSVYLFPCNAFYSYLLPFPGYEQVNSRLIFTAINTLQSIYFAQISLIFVLSVLFHLTMHLDFHKEFSVLNRHIRENSVTFKAVLKCIYLSEKSVGGIGLPSRHIRERNLFERKFQCFEHFQEQILVDVQKHQECIR